MAADCGLPELDDWQATALRRHAKRSLWLCSRQCGKSTTAALSTLHTALYEPGSLCLMVSPSQRQSSELFRNVMLFYRALIGAPEVAAESALRCEFGNASRVVSLPPRRWVLFRSRS